MYFWLILGLATLIVGGEFLVRGAVGIAKKFHISPLVIGMTVVSFGTSAPELMVSLDAAMGGHPDIAVGNVIGSNIANLALVLGLTVIIFPIVVDRNSKVVDWPMMMLATILFFVFSWDLIIEWWEGTILFSILVGFTFALVRGSRKKTKAALAASDDDEVASVKDNPMLSALFLIGGLVALYFGAGWLLDGAVEIAKFAGMDERMIGVTVVAFGTSVPELVTSAVAAFKKQTDISVGNLIGSNIFNIMAVIGLTSIVHPIPISDKEALSWDMWWVIGIAAALLPLMVIGRKLGRFKGVLLFGSYVVYITLVVMALQDQPPVH